MGLFDSWSDPGEFVGYDQPGVTATGSFYDFGTSDAVNYTTGTTARGDSIFSGSWLDSLSTLATKGMGIWQAIEQTKAQNKLAEAQIDAQRQRADTGGAFWQNLSRFMPWIVIGAVVVAVILIVRRK
jgi:hypothetical protein